MDIKNKIKSLIRETVIDFIQGDFNKIQAKLQNGLSISDLKEELSYWGPLTIPPDAAYENVHFYKYDDVQDMLWNLNFGLIIKEAI